MKTRISATKAARSFSDLVNRACYRGESFVVERRGRALCEIVPAGATASTIGDFVRLMRSIPKPDDEYLDIVEDLIKHRQPVAPSPWER